MSLNWDPKDIAILKGMTPEEWSQWQERCDYVPDITNWALMESLIFRSLVIGWGWGLTKDSLDLTIARSRIWDQLHRHGNSELDFEIPPAFIADMVGLSTNAGKITDAEFYKMMRRKLTELGSHAVRDYKRELETAAAAAQSVDSEVNA